MKKNRLLIVDDELDMLTGLARTLEGQMPELTVLTTNNAKDAIDDADTVIKEVKEKNE